MTLADFLLVLLFILVIWSYYDHWKSSRALDLAIDSIKRNQEKLKELLDKLEKKTNGGDIGPL